MLPVQVSPNFRGLQAHLSCVSVQLSPPRLGFCSSKWGQLWYLIHRVMMRIKPNQLNIKMDKVLRRVSGTWKYDVSVSCYSYYYAGPGSSGFYLVPCQTQCKGPGKNVLDLSVLNLCSTSGISEWNMKICSCGNTFRRCTYDSVYQICMFKIHPVSFMLIRPQDSCLKMKM